jgi:hypothetical protein
MIPSAATGQSHPEVVQRTTEFHDEITDTLLPQADAVFDDATALDTALDMVDPEPMLVQSLVHHGLLPRELLATNRDKLTSFRVKPSSPKL